VTLPKVAHVALAEHLAKRVEPEAAALMFTAPNGGLLRDVSWRQRFFKPAVKAAGLEPLCVP
jgi:hypothetical protein